MGQLRCATVQDYAVALAAESTAAEGNDDATAAAAVMPSRQYDIVWAIHTLHSIPSGLSAGSGGLAAALRAIRACLRPGGACHQFPSQLSLKRHLS